VAEQDVCPHLSEQFQTLVSAHRLSFLAVWDVGAHLSGAAEVRARLTGLPFRQSPLAQSWVRGWNRVCRSSSGQAPSCRNCEELTHEQRWHQNWATGCLEPLCSRPWRCRSRWQAAQTPVHVVVGGSFKANCSAHQAETWRCLCHYCVLKRVLGL